MMYTIAMAGSDPPVIVLCPPELATVLGTPPDAAFQVRVVSGDADIMPREIARAALAGGGIVALARADREVSELRRAGADQIVVVDPREAFAYLDLEGAITAARRQARERELRAAWLRAVVQGARTETVSPNEIIAGIGMELLRRPLLIHTRPGADPRGDPEVAAAMRETFYVIERIHTLQYGIEIDAATDLAKLVYELAPIVQAAVGSEVDVRVFVRGTPELVPLSEWRAAVGVFASVVALMIATETDAARLWRRAYRHASGEFPLFGNPIPGRGALAIWAHGISKTLTALNVSSDRANPMMMRTGSIEDSHALSSQPADVALALANTCIAPGGGSVLAQMGRDGGVLVTMYIPAVGADPDNPFDFPGGCSDDDDEDDDSPL